MKCCLVGWEKPIAFWREQVSVLECEAAQFGGLLTFRMYLRNDESTRFLFWRGALQPKGVTSQKIAVHTVENCRVP